MQVTKVIPGKYSKLDSELIFHSKNGLSARVAHCATALWFQVVTAIYDNENKNFINVNNVDIHVGHNVLGLSDILKMEDENHPEFDKMFDELVESYIDSIKQKETDILMDYAAKHLTREEMIGALRFRIFDNILKGNDINPWVNRLNKLVSEK